MVFTSDLFRNIDYHILAMHFKMFQLSSVNQKELQNTYTSGI